MKEKVLVTGASGYLASWIIKMLLDEGLDVHATVRSLHDRGKIDHLIELSSCGQGELKLFEADLLQPGSFDSAMEGCTLVIHTASPYLFEKCTDPERELLRPALDGTKNVLGSVERSDSVSRVVLTSSIVALYDSAREVSAGLVTAQDVNLKSSLRSNPYAYSKAQAESWAWQQRRAQKRWELISIHPGAIFGPSLSRRVDSTSVVMMRQLISGSFRYGVPRLWLGVVDVRDAAKAHVNAALKGEDQMRYIVVSENLRLLDIARLIDTNRFGISGKLPTREAPKCLLWLIAPLIGMRRNFIANNVNYPLRFDSENSRVCLGLNYYNPAKTFNDHVEQLLSDFPAKKR